MTFDPGPGGGVVTFDPGWGGGGEVVDLWCCPPPKILQNDRFL